ncbi:barstar family protein [Amycolatopsis sp. NPDC059090]|uniref:barstar family protein n=1 Tax=unclassified Amycolatopsis TaxID=2618356 RepID=UPI003670CA5F
MPLYRVVSEEDQPDFVLAFESLSGFFVDEPTAEKALLEGIGRAADAPSVTVDDAVIEVLGDSGKAIGEYYLGRLELRPKNISRAPDGSISLEVRWGGVPYPHAQEIWARWSRGSILPREWMQYPTAQHRDWMHVVQNAWFTSGKNALRYGTGDIVIDGRGLSSEASFYCAIGEAANGPGGYFGSNLDALEDCLRNGSVSGHRYSVVWNAVETSRRVLGEDFVTAVMEIFGENRVAVR